MWHKITEIIKKFGLNAHVYEDDDGENVLIMETSEDEEVLTRELAKDPDLLAILKEERGDIMPPSGNQWFLDKATDDNWNWSDCGFLCNECYKWHYFDGNGYSYYNNYWIGDGWIVCADCIKENEGYREYVLRELVNEPNMANTIFSSSDLVEMGFTEYNETYHNGMYKGSNDSPKEILEREMEKYPDNEFLFDVVKTYNPYEITFKLWTREVA